MKSVWYRNGSGGEWSQWYCEASGLSEDAAQKTAGELEAQSSDGWKSRIIVVDDGDNPNAE